MPTSLVTGGAGFLGSHLCEALLGKGHRVVCLDNLETGSLANIAHLRGDEFSFVHHDVSEPISIEEPLDFVYHLAALASRSQRAALVAVAASGAPRRSRPHTCRGGGADSIPTATACRFGLR